MFKETQYKFLEGLTSEQRLHRRRALVAKLRYECDCDYQRTKSALVNMLHKGTLPNQEEYNLCLASLNRQFNYDPDKPHQKRLIQADQVQTRAEAALADIRAKQELHRRLDKAWWGVKDAMRNGDDEAAADAYSDVESALVEEEAQ